MADAIAELGSTPEGCERLEKYLAAEHARASFPEFFRQAWKVVEPSTELVWNWHHQLLCTLLQVLFMDWLRTKRERRHVNLIRNVLVNVPPGTSKSKIMAVAFQAWCWLHWPGMKFICLSINDDAMMRDARDTRALVTSEWYRSSFGVDWGIKKDQDAVSDYGNTRGGSRLSMAAKSEIVGMRGDCLIADDLNNPKRAEQKRERDEVNDTWDTNQYNRVNDLQRSMRLAVQQRTNAGDHSGHVLETDGIWAVEHGEKPLRGPNGWLHVVLPAEFELERKFVMPPELAALMRQYLPEEEIIFEDPRTVEGETLDEVRMPLSVLEAERRRWAGTGNYAGQMQQRPQLVAGGMVQRSYFNFFRLAAGVRDEVDAVETGRPRPVHCHDGAAQVIHAAPLQPSKWDFDWITISIDPASKKTDKGSNYGILVVAGKGGRRYILDDRTQRGHLHEIFAVIKELILLWEPDSILIEPKAAGDSVMDALREAMGEGDLPMVTIDDDCDPGNADKEMRLDSVLSYFKNGMVYVLDGATWLEAFIEELTLFPNGTRDDRVDAVSQILGHVRPADGGGLPDW